MEITATLVKELRALTGAPVLDCKKALEASGGDLDKAVAWLKEKGLAKAAKKADRVANAGLLELYSHGGGRVGVMVEVNCETDFVARTEQFKTLAHELALQVAAASPLWLKAEDVPAEVVESERAEARQRAMLEGKAEDVLDKIAEGRMQKFFQEACLASQPYIRDDKKTVGELLQEAIGSMGENIVVRRFVRWELGGEA